jgi:hypothetical protein
MYTEVAMVFVLVFVLVWAFDPPEAAERTPQLPFSLSNSARLGGKFLRAG